MSEERVEEITERRVTRTLPASDDTRSTNATGLDATPGDAQDPEAKQPRDATRPEAPAARVDTARNTETGQGSPTSEFSIAKVRMQKRLPALDDDADIGVQKEHIVTRDGEADLRFSGVLLASAAPASAPKGHWQEYRIYRTNGEKHVFSKVARTVQVEGDTHEAEVFDPSPSSVPSQLLRSARELARSRPLTWMDAATAFFGYDPLAKALYRKLSVRFEEQIS
jgi:hypothetical protein